VSRRDQLFRRASLLLLVLWLLVLGASVAERQMRRRGAAVQAEPTPAARRGEERPVRLHSGLVYTDTIGIEPNFRLAARETLEFASGWYELKDVEVSIFHAGEVAYGLVASDARYNPQLREAQAHGNAQLSLSKGIALRADGFDLRGADRSFSSRGPVTFAAAGWGGVAGAVSGSAGENTIQLKDDVTASWRRGEGSSVVVLAPSLTYNRRRGVVQLDNGVTVFHRQNQLLAGSGWMRLRGPDGPPEELVLSGGVTVEARFDDGSIVQAWGEEMELRRTEGGTLDLRILPRESSGWVRAAWAGADGARRTLSAWRVVGMGSEEGGLQWVEGQGLVCLEESEARGGVPRQVRADSLRVDLAGGRAESATAWGNVRLEMGPQWGEGERLLVTVATRRSVLVPAAGGRVRFGSDSLEGKADRLEWDAERGLIAEGSVSGTVARGAVMGGREGPVQFAAARAVSAQDGGTLTLEGDARLWQGERLVRADRLEHRAAEELVVGRGNVLTVGSAAPRRETTGSGGVVRIAARALTYDAATMIATFEGDVRVVDEQAELAAQRVTATLGPGGELLLALFEGGLVARERAGGRTVAGQRARLVPGRDELEVWGDPVLITEAGGNQVKAAHLIWTRQDGVLRVLGGADSRSETLYHPERPLVNPRSSRQPPGRTPSKQ
jgi:lipopolysaccharide export system protein LptA